MTINPSPGIVCFTARKRQLSTTLVMPSSVDSPSDWVVLESGCDDYQTGDIIVPNMKHAGKVNIDDVEHIFIPAEHILAKVTR